MTPLLTQQLGKVMMEKILPIAAWLPLVTWIHFGLQRFTNLGMNRWWCLAIFAPFLNLWIGYRCFVCPAGYACHRKLDLPGILLAVLFWGLLAAAISALALHSGAVDNTVLAKQLRTLIQAVKTAYP